MKSNAMEHIRYRAPIGTGDAGERVAKALSKRLRKYLQRDLKPGEGLHRSAQLVLRMIDGLTDEELLGITQEEE